MTTPNSIQLPAPAPLLMRTGWTAPQAVMAALPEPVIQAQISVPDRGLTALMTNLAGRGLLSAVDQKETA